MSGKTTRKTEKKPATQEQPNTAKEQKKEPKIKSDVKKGGKKHHGKKPPCKVRLSTYVMKVMQQVCPGRSIGSKAMVLVNDLLNDILTRLLENSKALISSNNKATLTENEISAATRMILSGELSKHGVCEIQKAVGKYKQSTGKYKDRVKSSPKKKEAKV